MAGPNIMVGDDISVLAGNLVSNDLNGDLNVGGNLNTATLTIAGGPVYAGGVVGDTTIAGNLTISGSNRKILADFSSPYGSGRSFIQTSTTNGDTRVSLVPNGTGVTAQIAVSNGSSSANYAYGMLSANASRVYFGAGVVGAGTLVPLIIGNNGGAALTIDTTNTRLQADWSNATQNNRVCLQTTATNGSTNVEIIPNGTGPQAGINVENNSTIGNNAYGFLSVTNTRVAVGASTRGSGTALPLYLFGGTGATTSLGIDINGNVFAGGALSAAAATNATDGFLFINSCAGTPVGTPAGFVGSTGKVPLVIDTVNDKMYFYSTNTNAWIAVN